MFTALMTIASTAAALLAVAVIAASLAKGFAAAASLRRQLAECRDERWVTIRHGRTFAQAFTEHGFSPVRASRRTPRAATPLRAEQRRLVAA